MKTLTRAQLIEWLDRLATQQVLVAPQREGEDLFYRVVHHAQDVAWDDERPKLSAKEFLFPPSERLLKVEKRGPDVRLEPAGQPREQVLFGLRPCDARGIRIQDAAFLETQPADRAYALRREKTTTVGLACRNMGASCFCTAMGLGPDDARDVDLMLTDLGEIFAVRPMNARGEALLAGLALTDAPGDPPAVARRETASVPEGDAWAAAFGDARWQEFGDRCLSCRLCGYVCPTCRCYDVRDESLASPPGETDFERLRAWDTCMREGYRLTAGGHNPRAASGSRLRNRLLCKFFYYPHQYGPTACTGCGRCIDVCPVSLDLLEIGGVLQEAAL